MSLVSSANGLSSLFLALRRPRCSSLFPYTTLFRSAQLLRPSDGGAERRPHHAGAGHRRQHDADRSEEHTSELQSLRHLVCRLLLEKKKLAQQCLAVISNRITTHAHTSRVRVAAVSS